MSASLNDIHRKETEFLEVTEANGSSLSTDRFCTPSATSVGDTTAAVLLGKSVVGDRGKELHCSVSTLLSLPKVCCKASVNREFKQIATATSTTAVVDAVSWGEYVS